MGSEGRKNGRTDGPIEMTKLIVAFRNFATRLKIDDEGNW